MLGIYFENRLHQDLEDLRKELNIDLGKINAILDSDSSLVFKSQKEMDVFLEG